jgi:hypothetical protein
MSATILENCMITWHRTHNGNYIRLNLLGVNACGTIGVGSDAIGEPACESDVPHLTTSSRVGVFWNARHMRSQDLGFFGNNNDSQTSG